MPEKPGPQQRLLLTCSEHDWVLPNSDLDENGCLVLGWECQATHTQPWLGSISSKNLEKMLNQTFHCLK